MIDSEHLGELYHHRPRAALDRHMALIRLRIAEIKANPELARWHKTEDGVYRTETEVSVALAKATMELDG